MIFTYDIANVTCKRNGCGNKDAALTVYMRANGRVLCGVCGQRITDIVKTGTIDFDE